MGRERRVIDPESIYHVMCRGSDRKVIALDARDYRTLTGLLAKAATRYEWEIFAWCLMPNHYHVVMRTPNGGFSEGFRMLNQSHSFRFNRRHGRSAHLFRHRPHAIE